MKIRVAALIFPLIFVPLKMLVPDTELLEYYCQENEKDTKHMVGR